MRTGAATLVTAIGTLFATGVMAQAEREELLLERRFDVRTGGQLIADLGDMDIEIRSGRGSTARVRVLARARGPDMDMGWAREVFDRMGFEATGGDGDLRLVSRDPRIEWREWRRRGWVSLRAEVEVPGRYDLDLRTGDGDIAIGSFEGALLAHTGDGDIVIDRVRGPVIEVTTSDGDVSATALESDEIRLRTSDGDVRVAEVAGSLEARSGDGDISLDVARFDGLSIRTGDGDVWLAIEPSIAADVDLEGEDVDLGRSLILSGRVRERRVTGSLNGGGRALTVRTGDGSVTLRAR